MLASEAGGAKRAHGSRRSGPTNEAPALHLVFPTPRRRGGLTGEDVRLDLLRRMDARLERDQQRVA